MKNIDILTFNNLVESLLSKKTMDALLEELIKKLTTILKAQRATFYFYNEEAQELWSYIAKDLEIKSVRVPLGKGVAGHAAKTRKIINVKDTRKCKYFYSNIDKRTGYQTKTILAAPLINADKKLLGVIQIINKQRNSIFSDYDEVFLRSISYYIVIAIEKIGLLQEQESLLRSTLYALASAIDAKDPVTAGHSHRVAYYSVKMGSRMGFSDHDIKLLEYAAYLHDVGKIGIPENILSKKGKLTKNEYDTIKKHPLYSLQILNNIIFPKGHENIPHIASSHHEFLDGSGYPRGLQGKEINVFSRIIAIADVYDALSSFDRPYKKHLVTKKTLDILKQEAKKNHLDKKIVNLFITKKLYKLERRKYARLDINISLKYQIITQKKILKEKIKEHKTISLSDLNLHKSHFTESEDISAGGLLFPTKQYLPVGTYLDVDLTVYQKRFKCIGKVVWIENIVGTQNYKVGLSFVNLSMSIRNHLIASLQKLAKERTKKTSIQAKGLKSKKQ